MSNVPPLPKPTMEYLTPAGLAPSLGTVHREGDLIVGPKIVRLPAGCVKCGAPEARHFVKKFYWHHPAIYVVILLNILIYLVVAMIVRKRADVTFGLCAEHDARRHRKMAIAGALCVAFIATAVLFFVLASRQAAEDYGPFVGLVGFFGALFSLIGVLLSATILRPKLVNDFQVKLAGAGEPYLQLVQASEAAVLTAMPVGY